MTKKKAKTLQEQLQIQTECRAVLHVTDNVLHDRDCVCVRRFLDRPADGFRLLNHIAPEQYIRAQTCRRCIRKMAIRNGLDMSQKYVKALRYYFDTVGADTYSLRKLFITHAGRLRYMDNRTVEIHVREDTWRIVQADNRLQLYHRNYVADEDGFRFFGENFHRQQVIDAWDADDFGAVARTIWMYDYRRHRKSARARDYCADA